MNKRASLERFFLREWQQPSSWQVLLRPLSTLFGVLAALRRGLYRIGVLRTQRVDATVIVVGNISVGGTGKTPLVLTLVQALRVRGHTPGIITRGYAADAGGNTVANAGMSDEAELLAKRSGAPIVAHVSRARAAQTLLAANPDVDVIISDDGLQHYALARDIEIAVVDGARGIGNGQLLPAGPLRELPRRLQHVDAVVVNIANNIANTNVQALFQTIMPENTRQMASFDISLCSIKTPCYQMQYTQERFIALDDGGAHTRAAFVQQCAGKRIAAVAGIGNPTRFFAHVQSLGIALHSTHAFADHHAYTLQDIAHIDADLILMTEKDAVKCRVFAAMLDTPLWQMQIDATLPVAFFDFIATKIQNVTRSQTA